MSGLQQNVFMFLSRVVPRPFAIVESFICIYSFSIIHPLNLCGTVECSCAEPGTVALYLMYRIYTAAKVCGIISFIRSVQNSECHHGPQVLFFTSPLHHASAAAAFWVQALHARVQVHSDHFTSAPPAGGGGSCLSCEHEHEKNMKPCQISVGDVNQEIIYMLNIQGPPCLL